MKGLMALISALAIAADLMAAIHYTTNASIIAPVAIWAGCALVLATLTLFGARS